MERAIGEVFELDGVKLRVKESGPLCRWCYLFDIDVKCSDLRSIRGNCNIVDRIDKTYVIFTEVKE